MSELINNRDNRATIRWKLLTGVSALALTATVSSGAVAEDTDHPQLWIELGGLAERVDNSQEVFAPPFFALASPAVLAPMVDAQKQPLYSIGETGKISFAPDGSNWVFSAAVRYGRSNGATHPHYQGPKHKEFYNTAFGRPFVAYTPAVEIFGDGQASSGSSHLIADFQAGKDVGLGLFGTGGSSVVSAGVRFAQFASRSDVTLHARPVMDIKTKVGPGPKFPFTYRFYHITTRGFGGLFHAERNTHAIGPMLSWNASALIAGTDNGAGLALDWGANAAILFGKQRATTHRQTYGSTHTGQLGNAANFFGSYSTNHPTRVRSRTVTIPNVGGFAGVSLKFPNVKMSLGYRADFFFNAVDEGIDTRKSSTLGFYGPFATVSVGIGG